MTSEYSFLEKFLKKKKKKGKIIWRDSSIFTFVTLKTNAFPVIEMNLISNKKKKRLFFRISVGIDK